MGDDYGTSRIESFLKQEFSNRVLEQYKELYLDYMKNTIMNSAIPISMIIKESDKMEPYFTNNIFTFSVDRAAKKELRNFKPKNIWFTDGGVTTVEFYDGDKIVVKPILSDMDNFQPEYGVALAIARKVYGGNRSEFLRDVESSWNSYEGKQKGKMKKLSKESIKNSTDGFPF